MVSDLKRREFIANYSTALAALAVLHSARRAVAFPSRAGEVVIPWLDQPEPNPDPFGVQNQLVWEDLELLDHAQRSVLQHLAFRSPDH